MRTESSHSPFLLRYSRAVFVLLFFLSISLVGLRSAYSVDAPIITTTCLILTANGSSPVTGSSGTILFTCGVSAALRSTHPGSAKPSFTLPTSYTSLTLVAHASDVKTCNLGAGLVSGVEFSFKAKGSFDYCVSYSNAPIGGLASFTLTWARR